MMCSKCVLVNNSTMHISITQNVKPYSDIDE